MSTTNDSPYPERCPKCRAAAGLPYSAGTCERPGVILVKLRCQSCRHEWSSEAPPASADSVILSPRPDRRSARRPDPGA
jgi:hypothetical protein